MVELGDAIDVAAALAEHAHAIRQAQRRIADRAACKTVYRPHQHLLLPRFGDGNGVRHKHQRGGALFFHHCFHHVQAGWQRADIDFGIAQARRDEMRRAAIELHVFGRLYRLGLPQGIAKLAVQRVLFQGFKADALLHGRGAEQGFGGYAQLWLLFHHRLSGFGGENALPRHAAALEIGIPHVFQNRHQRRGFGQALDLDAV